MGLLRSAFLAGSQSRWLRERAVKLRFVRRAVSRFMPGEEVEAALDAARALQGAGIGAVLTYLGENLRSPQEAEQVARHYLDVLARAQRAGLDVEISVKLTQLGLDLDRAACETRLLSLIERAGAAGTSVWIDMESSTYTDATLDIYRGARSRLSNVGLCVQSYLRRTERDVQSLIPLGAGVRLVKQPHEGRIVRRLMKHLLPAVPPIEDVITVAARSEALRTWHRSVAYSHPPLLSINEA